jgi:putative flippase GtrA
MLSSPPVSDRIRKFWHQLSRFSLIGILNTVIDLLAFNLLLWLLPTHAVPVLLLYNAIAQCIAALNSFCFNKFWTFGDKQPVTSQQIISFLTVVAVCFCSNIPLNWLFTTLLMASSLTSPFWLNAAKISALAGTAIISFLVMRTWTFARTRTQATTIAAMSNTPLPTKPIISRSLSIVLTVTNVEQTLQQTIDTITNMLHAWNSDYEIIVVDDGSTDRTAKVLTNLSWYNPRIHSVDTHSGSALHTGCQAASKDLICVLDPASTFNIQEIVHMLPLLNNYDAVFGYHHSQDIPWLSRFHRQTWKLLVSALCGLNIHAIYHPCKIYHREFIQAHHQETQGAMADIEMLYTCARTGHIVTEVSIKRPATSQQPIGISRIAPDIRDLFSYTNKWYQEQQFASRLAWR